jgi:uncharacterized protein (TIGR03083 family)
MNDPNPSRLIEDFVIDAERFGAVVDAGGDWSAQSPCEEWTATDVLDHIISTQRDFLAKRDVEVGAEPSGSPAERWHAHFDLVSSVVTPAFVGRGFIGYFGPTTVADTLRRFYMLDLLVHRWDLATALGQPTRFTDEELDRLEDSLPQPGTPFHDTFYGPGVCKPPLPVDDAADRQTAVLAKFGRAT